MIEKYENILLIGASSEIGNSIIQSFENEIKNITFVGRNFKYVEYYINKGINTNSIFCDFKNENSFKKFLLQIGNDDIEYDLCILASGILPAENHELDQEEFRNILKVNCESGIRILMNLVQHNLNAKKIKIAIISSIATVRPRLSNFTYATTKLALDFYAQGLAAKYRDTNIEIKIIRTGYVHTKLTTNFKPAPFAIKPEKFKLYGRKILGTKSTIVYYPQKLRFIATLITFLPRNLLDLIKK